MDGELEHDPVGAGVAAAEGREDELAASGAVSAAIGRDNRTATTVEALGSTAARPRPPPHVPPLTGDTLGPSDGGVAAASAAAAVRVPPSEESERKREGKRDRDLGVQGMTSVSRTAADTAGVDAQAGSGEDERGEEEKDGGSRGTGSTSEKKKKKKKKSKKSKKKTAKDPSAATAFEQPAPETKADAAVAAESMSAIVADDCAESVTAPGDERGPLPYLEPGQMLNRQNSRQDGELEGAEDVNDVSNKAGLLEHDGGSELNRGAYQLSKEVAGLDNLAAGVDGSISQTDHVGRGSAGEEMSARRSQGSDIEPAKAGVESESMAGTEPSAGPTIFEATASADGEAVEGCDATGLKAIVVGGSVAGPQAPVADRTVIAAEPSAAIGAATEPVLVETAGAPFGGDVYTTDNIRAGDGGRGVGAPGGVDDTPEAASEAWAGVQSFGTVATRRAAVTRRTFPPRESTGGDQTERRRVAEDDGRSETAGGDKARASVLALPRQSFGVTETNASTGRTPATSSVGREATKGDQTGPPGGAEKGGHGAREVSPVAAVVGVGTTGIWSTRGTVRRPSLAAPSVGSETETTEGDQTEGEGTPEEGSEGGGGIKARERAVVSAVAEARSFAMKPAREAVRWPSLGAPSTGSETTDGDQAEAKATGEEETGTGVGVGAGRGVAFAPVTTGVGSLAMKEALTSRQQEQGSVAAAAVAAAALSTLDAPEIVPAKGEEREITSKNSGAVDERRGLVSDDTSAAAATLSSKNPEASEIEEDAIAELASDVAAVDPALLELVTSPAAAAAAVAAAETLSSGLDTTKPVAIAGRGVKEASDNVEAATPAALAIADSFPDNGNARVGSDGARSDGVVAVQIVGSAAVALTSRSDTSRTAVIDCPQADQGYGGQRVVAAAPPPAGTPDLISKALRSPEIFGVEEERRDEPTAEGLATNATESAAAAAAPYKARYIGTPAAGTEFSRAVVAGAPIAKPTAAVVPEVAGTSDATNVGTKAEAEASADLNAVVVEPAAESVDPTVARAERHVGVSVEASPALVGEETTGACEARAGAELAAADASVDPAAVAAVAAATAAATPLELSARWPTASKPEAEADTPGKAEEASVARTSSAPPAAAAAVGLLSAASVDALSREYTENVEPSAATAVVTTTTTTAADINSFTAVDGGAEETKVVDVFVSLGGGNRGAWPGSSDTEDAPGITVEEAATFMGSALSGRFWSGSSWATTATSTIADVDRAAEISVPAGSPIPPGSMSAAPLMSPSLAAAAATMFSGAAGAGFISPTNTGFDDGRRHRKRSSPNASTSASALVVPAPGEAPSGPHDVFLSATNTAGVALTAAGGVASTTAGVGGEGVVSTAAAAVVVDGRGVDGEVGGGGGGGGGVEEGRQQLSAGKVRQSDTLPGVVVVDGRGEVDSAQDAPPGSSGEGVRGEGRGEGGRLGEGVNGAPVASASPAAHTEPIIAAAAAAAAASGVVVGETAGGYGSQEGRGGGGGGSGGGGAAVSVVAASTKSAAGSAATSIVGNAGGEVETGSSAGDVHGGGRPISGGGGVGGRSGGGRCCVLS